MFHHKHKYKHIHIKIWKHKHIKININICFINIQIMYWGNQGSIKKTREAITPVIDTMKLCDSKYSFERSQGQCKKWCRIGRKGRQCYGIESTEGTEILRTMFRMAPECLMFYCFSLVFFHVFVDFKVNCNVN